MLPDIKIVLTNDCTLLGALISPRPSPKAVVKKHDDLIRMAGRLEQIDAHEAFVLLKNCFALPKLLYILCASPSYLNGAQRGALPATRAGLTTRPVMPGPWPTKNIWPTKISDDVFFILFFFQS